MIIYLFYNPRTLKYVIPFKTIITLYARNSNQYAKKFGRFSQGLLVQLDICEHNTDSVFVLRDDSANQLYITATINNR